MNIRPSCFVRIHTLSTLVCVILLILILNFLQNENFQSSFLERKPGSSDVPEVIDHSNNVKSTKESDFPKCKPKKKIGFLKIHKAASR